MSFNRFPDGEHYLRIAGEIKNECVTIIQSTPTDSDLVSLLQLIDACDEAKELNVVIPYMGYARQDKRFKLENRSVHVQLPAVLMLTGFLR